MCSLFVPNFKAITLYIKRLQRFLQVCKKNNLSPPNPPEEETKKKWKFDHPYLTNDYCKLIKIHCVASLGWRAASYNAKSRAFMKGSWNYICMCENCVLVLPVNILTVWCTGILGSTTHYRVSWYACLYKQVIATDYDGYPVYTPSHILHQASDHALTEWYV